MIGKIDYVQLQISTPGDDGSYNVEIGDAKPAQMVLELVAVEGEAWPEGQRQVRSDERQPDALVDDWRLQDTIA